MHCDRGNIAEHVPYQFGEHKSPLLPPRQSTHACPCECDHPLLLLPRQRTRRQKIQKIQSMGLKGVLELTGRLALKNRLLGQCRELLMTSRGVILEYIVLLVLVKVLVYSIVLVKTQGMVLDLAEVLAKKVMGLMVVLGLVLLRHSEYRRPLR